MFGATDRPWGESSPEMYAVHLCYQALLNSEPVYQKPTLIPSHDTSWLGNSLRANRDTVNQILFVYFVVESTTLLVALDFKMYKSKMTDEFKGSGRKFVGTSRRKG